MSSANHDRDSDWNPEPDSEDLNSDDEHGPLTTPAFGSSKLLKVPATGSCIPVFPPGHSFSENYVAVETDPAMNLVEYAVQPDGRKPNYKLWLNETIWSLFSVMAFDTLSSTQNTTNTWEANLILVASFDALIQNLDQMVYLQENLIVFFPGKILPPHVLAFILEIRDSKLTAKFNKTAISTGSKKKSTEEIKISQFGARIWTRAQLVRTFIMNRINKLWLKANRSKSGAGNNINSSLMGIQRWTWPMECIDRASNNASTYISRLKTEQKKDDSVVIPSFEETYQAAFRKVYVRENVNTWLPDYWLAFLLIGLPSGAEGRTVLGAGPAFAPKPSASNLLSPDAIKIISNTCESNHLL